MKKSNQSKNRKNLISIEEWNYKNEHMKTI